MPTSLVIEHFDVIEQLHLGGPVSIEPFAQLELEARVYPKTCLVDRVITGLQRAKDASVL